MSFLKENRFKIIIITVFSLFMAVLLRVYSVLGLWMNALQENYGAKQLLKIIIGSWQFYVFLAGFFCITSVLVFIKKVKDFIYRYRFVIAGLIFVFCVLFEISGSSMGQWCNDFNTADNDILIGISRPVRSDEYGLATPYFISQSMSESENAYDYFSDYVNGWDSDLFIGIRQPVKHVLTILRPFTLGFIFFAPAKGLSFWWCGKVIALFLATFEMGMLLSRKHKTLSFIMAALVTFSSVVQWWFSTSAAEILIYTETAMLLFNRYLVEDKIWKRMLMLVGILYQAGCFIMLLYPSWQVPFVYVILVLTAWIIIKNSKNVTLKWFDYASILAGVAGLAAVFVYIFTKSADTIELISQSVYPGERLETGGGSLAYTFTYPLNIWFSITNFSFGSNICESATFFDFFPFSVIIPVVAMIKNRKKDILSILLLGLNLFFFIWIAFGFPEVIAKITFLSNSQSIRTVLVFGFVNIMLLIRGISLMKESSADAPAIGISIGISTVVMVVALVATGSARVSLSYKIIYFSAGFLILAATIFVFIKFRKKNCSFIAVLLIVIISMVNGIMVNPVRKGLDSVYDIDWLKEINKVCDKNGKDELWAVECSNLNTLPYTNAGLLCGVRTINATAIYPNPELWKMFDPYGGNSHVYNRFSHIGICIKESGEPEFELITEDSFKVYMTIDDLKNAGVTYVTGLTDLSVYAKKAECKVTRVNDSDTIYIYMLE